MTTTRAAKYLAPIDIGKTITITGTHTRKTITGELQSIDATHLSDIALSIIAGKDSGTYYIEPDAEVTLTGQPSPPTDNPHGSDQAEPAQPLPAPIPAAQAADHAGHVPHFTVNRDGSIEQHLELHIDDSKLRAAAALAAKRDYLKIHTTAAQAADAHRPGYEPLPGGCPCGHPEKSGHFDPACPVYCSDCNHDSHTCPGCGIDINHDQSACRDCKAMTAGEWQPDHEHIATLQNPEHCVLCGERLEYDENGNRK